jgi:WD40 repeat protein/serine/threonine protein kinase
MSAPQSQSGLVLELAEEFLERYRQGERPALKEYIDRHPDLAAEIREVFPAMALMENIALADESLAGQPPAAPALQQLGDYRIVREIGRGGMGIVYEAEQLSLGRHVALKLLPQTVLADAGTRRRFEREARAAAKLHHTNIVPVFGVGEHDGQPYYVMQFIQGQGLDAVLHELRRLRRGGDPTAPAVPSAAVVARSLLTGRFQLPEKPMDAGPLPSPAPAEKPTDGTAPSGSSVSLPGQSGEASASRTKRLTYYQSVAQVGLQVAQALEYAHKQGIVHRDVKPSNLLLDMHGTVWITDFGLAKTEDQQDLTHPGEVVGTLRYIPPERFRGQTDGRGDLYSLGLTLYELLTLQPAYEEANPHQLIEQILNQDPVPPRQRTPGLPRDLETIVRKATERDPAHRYATAGALAADLQHFLDDEPIHARPLGSAERLRRWCRRNPALAGTLAAALAFLILGTVVSSLFAVHAFGEAARADREAQSVRAAMALGDRRYYISEIKVASLEWEANQLGLMLERLRAQEPKGPEAPDLRGFEWHYLRRLCQPELRTLPGLLAVAFSPDGRWLATSQDKTVRLWDTATCQEILALEGHTEDVTSVAFSPDGRRLASTSRDKTLRLWDTATGQTVLMLAKDFAMGGQIVAFSPDGRRVAASCFGTTVQLWDAVTGKEVLTLKGPTNAIVFFGLAFSPDGRWLAVGCMDKTVRVWDMATGQQVLILKGHAGVYDVAFSPDSRRLVAGDWDGGVSVWDVATGKAILARQHAGGGLTVAFSPDGRRFASAGRDRTVRVWDSATGREVLTLRGHTAGVNMVTFSPDGWRLASASGDGTVRLWDAATDQQAVTLRHHATGSSAEQFGPEDSWEVASRNSRHLAAGDADRIIRRWSAELSINPTVVKGSNLGLAFSPDGRQLASGGWDQTVIVWDWIAGQEHLVLRGHTDRVTNVAFSADGRRLASASADRTIKVWDAQTGQEAFTLHGHTNWVMGVAFSPNGLQLASASYDQTLRVWDATTGQQRLRLAGHQHAISGVAFSPDARRLASASDDETVRVWDLATGQEALTLRGHLGRVFGVSFSPDGRWLASAGADRTVRLWDATAGQEVRALRGHTDGVYGVTFSPDGNRLASASVDGTVRVWDVPTGQEALSHKGHTDQVAAVVFSPDGRQLASASWDRTVCVRDATALTPQALTEREARGLLRFLFGKLLLAEDVIAAVRRDPTIAEAVRQQALVWATSWREDAEGLNAASWIVVRHQDAGPEDVRQALRRAVAACRLEPKNGNLLNTLGIAQYRAAQYPEALATLTRAEPLNAAAFKASHPADLAFLAMTHYRLGHTDQAQAQLERLRAALKQPQWANGEESQDFLREAEALLTGKQAAPGK